MSPKSFEDCRHTNSIKALKKNNTQTKQERNPFKISVNINLTDTRLFSTALYFRHYSNMYVRFLTSWRAFLSTDLRTLRCFSMFWDPSCTADSIRMWCRISSMRSISRFSWCLAAGTKQSPSDHHAVTYFTCKHIWIYIISMLDRQCLC